MCKNSQPTRPEKVHRITSTQTDQQFIAIKKHTCIDSKKTKKTRLVTP